MASGSGLTSSGLTGFAFPNAKLDASISGNALTVALIHSDGSSISTTSPIYAAFRTTAASGAAYEGRAITSVQPVTISAGSDMNTVNATPFRIHIGMFDDGGVYRLAAINCIQTGTSEFGIFPIDENSLLSALAEGGAGGADVPWTYYAGVAISSKPLRYVGALTWESGLTTAGNWDALPDTIQMYGIGGCKPGDILQWRDSFVSTLRIFTGTVPLDNTIPQPGEGQLHATTRLTPSSKANYIESEALINCSPNVADTAIVTIIQDSTGGAKSVGAQYIPAGVLGQISLRHRQIAGVTTNTVFTLLVGTAGGNTLTVNGVGGSALFGGALLSGLRTQERYA
jgi:hypothetical protein